MLRSMDDLENYSIAATDGNIGKIADFLFDDKAWVVRYFVVETGSWLSSRKVLISPIGIQKANWREKVFLYQSLKSKLKTVLILTLIKRFRAKMKSTSLNIMVIQITGVI